MENESSFWAIFGKVSAVITTLGTLIGIWVVFSQVSEDLELFVESYPYSISPDMKVAIDENFDAFSYVKLNDLLKKDTPVDIHKNEFNILNFIQEIHKNSWGNINKYSLDKFNGYSSLYLTNEGEKTATDIEINFPHKGLVLIKYPDATQVIEEFSRVIKLNDLRAHSNISLLIWSKSNLSSYEYDDIKLTHKNGVGKVSSPVIATGLSWYFAEYPLLSIFIVYMIFMLGVIWGAFSSKKNTEEKDENESEIKNA